MDESEILSRLLSHDERGLQAAQECYGARLTALARRIAGSETAEECVNDALLAAWNAIPPLRPRSLYAYLCRLTRNAALNRFAAQSAQKRGGTETALSLDELDDCAPALSSPDDEAMAAELGRSISAFLRTQSEEVRSMFILRYFYCEPVEALAARFHCGESRIKTTLLRTRRKLKEHLIKEGYCEA